MAEEVQRLGQFDTKTIVPLLNRAPDIYDQRLSVVGNSLLSTVFVKSLDPGASVHVEYFDYGVGIDDGEEIPLNSHDIITTFPLSSKILISNLHDKPNIRCTVVGGNAEFGVYVSVVLSSASDIDNALQREGEPTNLVLDKGIPIMVYDEANSVWRFARGALGIQDVRIVGNVSVGEPGAAEFFETQNATTPGVEQTILSYTVSALKTLNLLSMIVVCRAESHFEIYGDGDLIGSGRTGAASPNINFPFRVARMFTSGKIIEVKLTTRTGSAVSRVECYLQGTLSP